MVAQLIHVVRHAHAGDRAAWTLDDDLRPLSDRGIGQAERLAERLSARAEAVYSSPSLRCLATVLPFAQHARLPLCTLTELYEGGTATAMLERLKADQLSPIVACTHGDVIADLLRLLIAARLTPPSPRAEKGSTWTVEIIDGRFSEARYQPPP
jgi:broad specificity phosphatase PhoE